MLKVIQLGIGGMGNVWLQTVRNSSEVEHAAFVETNPETAQQQAGTYGLDPALIYRTLPEALAAVQADAVLDITPPQFHEQMSITALEAGLHVLSEKPLADTRAAAQAIVRKADDTGLVHMVAQNYRYRVPVMTLKQVLDSGELGRIGAVQVAFYRGPHPGGFREVMAYPLIIDMAIHHFDLMRFLLEREPVEIYGKSWNPPWSWYAGDASATVALEFADGVVVSYSGSWCSQGKQLSWNGDWRIECERGVIWMLDDEVYLQRVRADLVPLGFTFMQIDNDPPEQITPVTPAYTEQGYLLHTFYEAITQGTPPPTRCQDNIHSLNIVFDTIQAFESGAPVKR
ncbi:MAG: Gfo/Idh/MocA family oxidoreductase [Chloroflexi bacterium]|nr:Gfo/Idh/MocA family oxidoreductase [Chloroflexota bacterium]